MELAESVADVVVVVVGVESDDPPVAAATFSLAASATAVAFAARLLSRPLVGAVYGSPAGTAHGSFFAPPDFWRAWYAANPARPRPTSISSLPPFFCFLTFPPLAAAKAAGAWSASESPAARAAVADAASAAMPSATFGRRSSTSASRPWSIFGASARTAGSCFGAFPFAFFASLRAASAAFAASLRTFFAFARATSA